MTGLEGGCLCGAVRYRVRGDALHSVICHCRTCRRASAAPSVAWVTFRTTDFQLLQGALRSFRSSPAVVRTFCEQCGSPITYATERSADCIDVTSVSLDDPSRFAPTREIWLEHRIPWEVIDARLEQHARGSED